MIILDANILKSTSLRDPAADVLRAIRAGGVERVAAPWIAMEEIAAQQALAYRKKHDAAMRAVDELRKATPWEHVAHPKRWPAEHVREHWRERYSSIAEVIETSPEAYRQAMFRETNLIAPCKTVNSGKNKTGARDAAIWLTAVEYARAHPAETVYFISNNTEDFGDGTSLPEPMDRDIRDMEHRFFLLTSLDGVLTKFATELEASVEDVQALLDTEAVRTTVLQSTGTAAKRYRMVRGSRITSESGAPRLVPYGSSSWKPTAVALDKVLNVSGREVGGHHWFTATVRWLLAESPLAYVDEPVAYAWETRVLLSPTAEKTLTVLDSKPPAPIAPEDILKVPETTWDPEAAALAAQFFDRMAASPHFEGFLKGLTQLTPDFTKMEAALRELTHRAQGAAESLPEPPTEEPQDEKSQVEEPQGEE
ncbi:PIN domain-containing protein [Streptomyces sp. NPDC006307]|uniref:PIN domain-containing protein n=1 Tax=Streptomyces sp. NPDC006307 TaxID=3156748 RepID=UPI0033BB696E